MAPYDWKVGLYKAAKVAAVGAVGYLAANPDSLTALAAIVPQPYTPIAVLGIMAAIAAAKNWAKVNGYLIPKI